MTDLASSPTFDGWTVHLLDLNEEAAATMTRVRRRSADQRGAKRAFTAHASRRDSLAGVLGLASGEVHAVFAGLNHLCWLLDLRRGAEDLYPQLRQLVAERAGGLDAPSTREEGVHLPVSADLFRTFGRYPAPGDRHVA